MYIYIYTCTVYAFNPNYSPRVVGSLNSVFFFCRGTSGNFSTQKAPGHLIWIHYRDLTWTQPWFIMGNYSKWAYSMFDLGIMWICPDLRKPFSKSSTAWFAQNFMDRKQGKSAVVGSYCPPRLDASPRPHSWFCWAMCIPVSNGVLAVHNSFWLGFNPYNILYIMIYIYIYIHT